MGRLGVSSACPRLRLMISRRSRANAHRRATLHHHPRGVRTSPTLSAGLRLPREFYARQTLDVARKLLGMHLVRVDAGRRRVGRIVETEAYKGPEDLASHSSKGRTARTEGMFGPPGRAYVYFIYGFWSCVNVVTEAEGVPHAVLLRALEPVDGLDDKTWGPGLLCRAMGIDRRLNGADVCGEVLWIERPPIARPVRVGRSARIGVESSGAWAARPWRFFDADSPYVSTVPPSARTRAVEASRSLRVNRG